MKLSPQDADLYFELMWSLLFFANQKLNLISDVASVTEYQNLSQEEKLKVRNKLFSQPKLIDDYVQKNPDQFSKSQLDIVRQWKKFVRGNFYIERNLKKHTVFIGDNDSVYAVLGLYESFSEMIHKSYFPMYVEAILLPFKGQIIYDGLMQTYSLHFGSGIKSDLKEVYLRAKQQGKIVTSLEADSQLQAESAVQAENQRDWKPEIEKISALAKKLRGGAGQPAVYSPAFSLLKASVELALVGVTEPENARELDKKLQKVARACRKVEDTIYRM